ncbi:MAG: DoxX family protein [Deltaproteobacteria bacterium]|nr:MAG: DoxX family protein [Deltaproteobacteria bacterium]TMA55298.1 MAG: DoxX family protein [Deltaproteobacteria bacterium]
MPTFTRSYETQTYALLRMVAGFLFFWHGTQKLFGFPGAPPAGAPPFVVYVGGGLELVCGALVMIGLTTSWAAFIASGEMAVAYWLAHGTRALLPIQNQGELAVLYCFAFLYIAARGPGIWALDSGRGES